MSSFRIYKGIWDFGIVRVNDLEQCVRNKKWLVRNKFDWLFGTNQLLYSEQTVWIDIFQATVWLCWLDFLSFWVKKWSFDFRTNFKNRLLGSIFCHFGPKSKVSIFQQIINILNTKINLLSFCIHKVNSCRFFEQYSILPSRVDFLLGNYGLKSEVSIFNQNWFLTTHMPLNY